MPVFHFHLTVKQDAQTQTTDVPLLQETTGKCLDVTNDIWLSVSQIITYRRCQVGQVYNSAPVKWKIDRNWDTTLGVGKKETSVEK